jgi:TRAP-type C4-dicarboxylate transport system permease small subunit
MRVAPLAARVIDWLAIATFCGMFACVLGQVGFRTSRRSADVERRARTISVRVVPFLGWIIAARRRSHLAIGSLPSAPRRAYARCSRCSPLPPRSRSPPCSASTARASCSATRRRYDDALLHVGVVYAVVPLATLAVALYAIADAVAAVRTLGGGRRTRDDRSHLVILGVWFVALFAGPAIYAAMGLAGFAFLFIAGIPGIVIPQKVAMAANSFPLLAAPLFILMGNLMNSAGISYRIFDFAKAVVGWMRGGLCQANIIGSVIFAGMSGSAVAMPRARHGRDRGDEEGRLRCRDRGGDHRGVGDDRADHSAVAADDRLRRRRRDVDRRPLHRRRDPGTADGRCA